MPATNLVASDRIPAFSVFIVLACAAAGFADDRIDFAKDIKPIFAGRCYRCHGAKKQEAGLRLDARDAALDGGDSGVVIVPGSAGESELFERISTDDADKLMPPEGERLSEKQVKLLRQWIDQGAAWPDEVGVKNMNKQRRPLHVNGKD